MPVPLNISDLSTTPGSNSPAGSESPALMDDYLRTAFAFIKQVSDTKLDASSGVALTGNQTIAGTKTFSSPIAGSVTGTAANVTGAVAIANGGTGQTTAAGAFNAIKQAATEAATGVVELATTAEAQAATDATRALTPARLKDAQIQGATPVSASGAAVDFTGIPSWAKRVLMVVQAGSFSGAGALRMQVGPSTGVATSGYSGSNSIITAGVASSLSSSGFELGAASATNVFSGILELVKVTGNVWVGRGVFSLGDTAATLTCAGFVSLPGALDRVRFTSTTGVNFDGGVVNVFWE